MIAYITGKVHSYGSDWVILDHMGLGYRIFFAYPERLKLNEEVCLYTYQYIREDEHSLYGFLNMQEYEFFLKLISVKGVGCKTANAIFAASRFEQLVLAIENADLDYLKRLPGIGAKTASQIILVLKGKLISTRNEEVKGSRSVQEALEALKALGYKQNELTPLLKELEKSSNESVDVILKLALQLLAQRRRQ